MKKYKFEINGNKYSVEINSIEDNKAEIEVNGTLYTVELEEKITSKYQTPIKPIVSQTDPVLKPKTVVATAPAAPTSGSSIKSPLPGVILDVFVKIGDTVTQGQRLVLLEAMKMENNIDADKAGVIKEIRVNRSDVVMEGDVLLVIE